MKIPKKYLPKGRGQSKKVFKEVWHINGGRVKFDETWDEFKGFKRTKGSKKLTRK